MTTSTTAQVPATGGYAELARRVRAAGLTRRRPGWYAGVLVVLLGVLSGSVAAMVAWRDSWWLLLLAPVLAAVSTQMGFLGHDVGHLQVLRGPRRSRPLGIVVGNGLAGLSYGWWVAKHNAHHAHPNDLATDPDVAVGALVWTAHQAEERRGAAAFVTAHQSWLFVPMLLGEAFALHVHSVRTVLLPTSRTGLRWRGAEVVLLGAHLAAYAVLLVATLTWRQALVFLLVQKALQGLYLGLSFAPGHKGMPVLGPREAGDPLLRQVLTSRNIVGGRFVDAALGGLNYQVEHHLFPSMPRPHLRRARPLVKQFCDERGVPYTEVAARSAYAAGFAHLHAVGTGLRAR